MIIVINFVLYFHPPDLRFRNWCRLFYRMKSHVRRNHWHRILSKVVLAPVLTLSFNYSHNSRDIMSGREVLPRGGTDLLEGVPRKSTVAFADNLATKATLLLNRGRQYAFEKNLPRL
ncbi:hypothetical protein ACHAXM_004115 [Skeletonema potamos]